MLKLILELREHGAEVDIGVKREQIMKDCKVKCIINILKFFTSDNIFLL